MEHKLIMENWRRFLKEDSENKINEGPLSWMAGKVGLKKGVKNTVKKAATGVVAKDTASAAVDKLKNRIIKDQDGRLMIAAYTTKGPVVFQKSSGTSQIKLLGFDKNKKPIFGANDRPWLPIGGLRGNWYVKFNNSDPRFGKGAPTGNLVQWETEIDNIMVPNHGRDWPQKIDYRKPEQFSQRAYDDLQILYQKQPENFQLMGPVAGKYPSPDSEFGKISNMLSRLENSGEIFKSYGKPVKVDDGMEIQTWFDNVSKDNLNPVK